MLSTSGFSKENSAISLEECVLVLKVFTTATRKFRVKIRLKTKTWLERQPCGATGNGMDKDNKGQRKLEDSGKGLFPAVEGHSLPENSTEQNRTEWGTYCCLCHRFIIPLMSVHLRWHSILAVNDRPVWRVRSHCSGREAVNWIITSKGQVAHGEACSCSHQGPCELSCCLGVGSHRCGNSLGCTQYSHRVSGWGFQ